MADDLRTRAIAAMAHAYCLDRFNYDSPTYADERFRQSHIAMDAATTAEEPWVGIVVDAVLAQVRAELLAIADETHAPYNASLNVALREIIRSLADRIAPAREAT